MKHTHRQHLGNIVRRFLAVADDRGAITRLCNEIRRGHPKDTKVLALVDKFLNSGNAGGVAAVVAEFEQSHPRPALEPFFGAPAFRPFGQPDVVTLSESVTLPAFSSHTFEVVPPVHHEVSSIDPSHAHPHVAPTPGELQQLTEPQSVDQPPEPVHQPDPVEQPVDEPTHHQPNHPRHGRRGR